MIQIVSIDQVVELARDNRAIRMPGGQISSASFVSNMSAQKIKSLINSGIFLYEKHNDEAEAIQALLEARDMLIIRGIKKRSIALAGINAVLKRLKRK